MITRKKVNMNIEDIKIISINIKMTHNKSNEFLKYGILFEYKGERHSQNFITVKKNELLYDLDHLKNYIVNNTWEINGKWLTGLESVDTKIIGGLI